MTVLMITGQNVTETRKSDYFAEFFKMELGIKLVIRESVQIQAAAIVCTEDISEIYGKLSSNTTNESSNDIFCIYSS